MAPDGDAPRMAKGYPVRQEAAVLPECAACGSSLFIAVPDGLRCEDCGALRKDPFTSG